MNAMGDSAHTGSAQKHGVKGAQNQAHVLHTCSFECHPSSDARSSNEWSLLQTRLDLLHKCMPGCLLAEPQQATCCCSAFGLDATPVANILKEVLRPVLSV
jgi:hypothetical protein